MSIGDAFSERQILITITSDLWEDEDQEELMAKVDHATQSMLGWGDYSIQEFTK